MSLLSGGKTIHAHINNCIVVPIQPGHLVLNPLPNPMAETNKSANHFRYSEHSAKLFEGTEEDNAPAPLPEAPWPASGWMSAVLTWVQGIHSENVLFCRSYSSGLSSCRKVSDVGIRWLPLTLQIVQVSLEVSQEGFHILG